MFTKIELKVCFRKNLKIFIFFCTFQFFVSCFKLSFDNIIIFMLFLFIINCWFLNSVKKRLAVFLGEKIFCERCVKLQYHVEKVTLQVSKYGCLKFAAALFKFAVCAAVNKMIPNRYLVKFFLEIVAQSYQLLSAFMIFI